MVDAELGSTSARERAPAAEGKKPLPENPWVPSLKIVLAFLLISMLWIPLSDWAAATIAGNEDELNRIQTIKGWTYLLGVSVLLFFLVSRSIRSIQDSITAERAALVELEHANEQKKVLLAALLNAEEAERQRLAADLHDDTLQVLTSSVMRLELLAAGTAAGAAPGLAAVADDVRAAMRRLRSLVFELRPAALDRGRLADALERFLEEATSRHEVKIEYEIDDLLTSPLGTPTRETVYRVAREALLNALKHSRTDRIEVRIWRSDGNVNVQIRDHGTGFDRSTIAAHNTNLGLSLMEEKARLMGGQLDISSISGAGTTVRLRIPDIDEAGREQAKGRRR